MSHSNLVNPIGYCIEKQGRLLVIEFIASKSLKAHLHGKFLSCSMRYIYTQNCRHDFRNFTNTKWDCRKWEIGMVNKNENRYSMCERLGISPWKLWVWASILIFGLASWLYETFFCSINIFLIEVLYSLLFYIYRQNHARKYLIK